MNLVFLLCTSCVLGAFVLIKFVTYPKKKKKNLKKKKKKKEIVKHTKHLSPVELRKILIISINPKDLLLSDFSDIKFLFLNKLYNAKVFFFFFLCQQLFAIILE